SRERVCRPGRDILDYIKSSRPPTIQITSASRGRPMLLATGNTTDRPMRMSEQLVEQGISCETLPHPPAYTSQRLAKYLHVPGRQVAKSVLLKGPAGYALAILPATHRIDMNLLGLYLGQPLRLANCDELALVFTDCEWGMAAPFGSRYGL